MLEKLARQQGLDSVEHLIKAWLHEAELRRRQELGERIDAHRERMFAKYGLMEDSTAIVREDRER